MAHILLLHTGGTLGMQHEPLEPGAYAAALVESLPEFSGFAQIESRIVCNLDSSDIGPETWVLLAETIAAERERYDAFLIVHGTDTMAYTASALAFALQGLDRPVILTGAQRPLGALRTDARRNLADAIELATMDVPEVGICFDGLLLRGCRATKTNTRSYHAFDSPGCQPLAQLGVDISLASHIRRPLVPFHLLARFDPRVVVIQVSPGMNPKLFEPWLERQEELRGIVLVAFGVGTVPSLHRPVAPFIRRAVDAGIEVIAANHSAGLVNLSLYENSQVLADAGAVAGGQMLVEAAVCKLMHALGNFPEVDERRRYLRWNIAGEME